MDRQSQNEKWETQPDIVWVGDQRLWEGYCGRAIQPATKSVVPERTVAVVKARPRQITVHRIGPPRSGPTKDREETPLEAAPAA